MKNMIPMIKALMAVKTVGSKATTNILFTGIAKPEIIAVAIASNVPRVSLFIFSPL
jgi:hypothetical protein